MTLAEVNQIIVSVRVAKNGAEAKYGRDFIAFYGDKELTEDEYVVL